MPAPRRTRAAMSAETTERLIAVARRQFAEKGFTAVVMDELCAEADLTGAPCITISAARPGCSPPW